MNASHFFVGGMTKPFEHYSCDAHTAWCINKFFAGLHNAMNPERSDDSIICNICGENIDEFGCCDECRNPERNNEDDFRLCEN